MDTIPLVKTESAVANERRHDLEILKNKGSDLNQIKTEITAENSDGTVNSLLQPFKVFKPTSGNGFGKGQTDFLVDYIIKTHHEFAKKNAAVIYNLAQKVTYRHCDNHPELLTLNKIIFFFLHDLLNHMKEEEQFTFPRLRQKANAIEYTVINDTCISQSLERKIKVLRNEHAKSFTYLKALRQLTNNFGIPSDACNSYKVLFEKIKDLEDDLYIHFHLEDDILFPNALLLTEYD
jgi:regulator of cell morphogenesis and NO signaling